MIRIKNRARFLSAVLGNIVICVTVAALILVTATGGSAAKADAEGPYYSGKSDTKLSLMVNVYWGTEYIPDMLEIFADHGVKTTFFVGGSWAEGNAKTLQAIRNAGHELGNHGYYHKDHSKIGAERNRKEISAAHETVKRITGVDMTLFAPPSGAFCDDTLAAASELGYRTIMWTRDTIDWRDKDAELIYTRATRGIKGGDLILMHPTAATVKALERIIAAAYAQDLRIAPVSEVINALPTA